MQRRKPFSGKQKREQLKARADRKPQWLEDAEIVPESSSSSFPASSSTSSSSRARPSRGLPPAGTEARELGTELGVRLLTSLGKSGAENKLSTVVAREENGDVDRRRLEATRAVDGRRRGRRIVAPVLSQAHLIAHPQSILDRGLATPATFTEEAEVAHFRRWLTGVYRRFPRSQLNTFEHNLEVWRQLWHVVRLSDVVVLLVDVRNPLFHLPRSLYEQVTQTLGKRMVVALSKADLVSPDHIRAWIRYLQREFPLVSAWVPFTASGAALQLHAGAAGAGSGAAATALATTSAGMVTKLSVRRKALRSSLSAFDDAHVRARLAGALRLLQAAGASRTQLEAVEACVRGASGSGRSGAAEDEEPEVAAVLRERGRREGDGGDEARGSGRDRGRDRGGGGGGRRDGGRGRDRSGNERSREDEEEGASRGAGRAETEEGIDRFAGRPRRYRRGNADEKADDLARQMIALSVRGAKSSGRGGDEDSDNDDEGRRGAKGKKGKRKPKGGEGGGRADKAKGGAPVRRDEADEASDDGDGGREGEGGGRGGEEDEGEKDVRFEDDDDDEGEEEEAEGESGEVKDEAEESSGDEEADAEVAAIRAVLSSSGLPGRDGRGRRGEVDEPICAALEALEAGIHRSGDASPPAALAASAAPDAETRRLVVGFVGHPNVGKSSLINTLAGAKRVSVSRTPGHTKRYQTIEVAPETGLVVLDCPGLLFPYAFGPPRPGSDEASGRDAPEEAEEEEEEGGGNGGDGEDGAEAGGGRRRGSDDDGDADEDEERGEEGRGGGRGRRPAGDGFLASFVPTMDPALQREMDEARALQELCGVVPLSQVREAYTSIRFLLERLPLESMYGLRLPPDEPCWSASVFCDTLAAKRGLFLARTGRPDAHAAGRAVLYDVVDGVVPLAFWPPGTPET